MSASKNVSAHTLKSDLTRLDPRAIDYGRFSELATGLAQLDRSAYAAIGKDPLMPVMGLGLPDAPLCIMGRDPGRAGRSDERTSERQSLMRISHAVFSLKKTTNRQARC